MVLASSDSGVIPAVNGDRSFLRGVALSAFLQMLGSETKSCVLGVRSGKKEGTLQMAGGHVADARTDHKEGEDAVYEMLSWGPVDVVIRDEPGGMIGKIGLPVEFLILNSLQFQSETNGSHNGAARGVAASPGGANGGHEKAASWSGRPGKNHTTDTTQEHKMNIEKLRSSIQTLQRDLGDGLLSTDILTAADGQSVVGYKTNEQACALFSQVTSEMNQVLRNSGFPEIGKYYLINLADDKMVLVIPLADFQWLMLLDSSKIKLGLLLNVVLPQAIDVFEMALAE